MSRLRFETTIKRSPETVFQLLADLSGYASWLPASPLYSETTAISDRPIKVGTTYRDKGSFSEMYGEVTELEPCSHLAFRQSSHSRLRGEVDIRIRYTLRAVEDGTQVRRDCTVRTRGMLKMWQPVLVRAISQENDRILKRLKWYLEAR